MYIPEAKFVFFNAATNVEAIAILRSFIKPLMFNLIYFPLIM